ncbi:SGNH/GDSL hydrolase family protein [Bradyrhizobium sp. cf659]|uniref:SGNH/GDSL hydrolase family protein n=1 Tax=Bradyrhizobium sp. cf659 TaxID=1761771 RepID=UPI0011609FA3|nr:SGNH/GDSL hydrolase family protein [Bradyrhizobium sp. cf659]
MTTLGSFLRTTSLIVGNTLLLTVVCLLIGEWWARSIAPPPPEARKITVQNQYGAFHPWAGFRNTPGFRYELGNWVPIVINSWGWRGPEPKIERSKSVRRAILLGDSVGFSCWGCREEASLGGELKRALELRTDEEWEVINTSVGAGFSSVSLGTLAHDAMQFRPDVVTSLNGINDMLVLDDRTILRFGEGLFKHSLYYKTQVDMAKAFDPRTGKIQQQGVLQQLAAGSALVRLASPLLGAPQAMHPFQGVTGRPTSEGYSTANLERLDTYVSNQLAMSYLAEGAGAKFVGFLQPYFSLQHKIVGEVDKEVIKRTEPSLLKWMDEVYPVVRSKLQAAADRNPSYHYVDLSLMFTREQVFEDLAHMKYETLELSTGGEMMAGRMADEIVRALYAGKVLPDWRRSHIPGTPHDWKEAAYLSANPDVGDLISEGKFKNGFEHYRAVGFLQFRHSGFPSWNEKAYLEDNPDVAALIRSGAFASGYEHYVRQGRAEGRRKGMPMRWIEETYLAANPDVAAAVKAGKYGSGEEHYMKVGALENRRGGFSGWDEEGYIIPYGDVRNAITSKMFRSGIEHYLAAGAVEKRNISLGLPSFH